MSGVAEERIDPGELQALVRSFINRYLDPIEAEVDASGIFPHERYRELVQKSRELGMFGYNIPVEYGGGGFTCKEQIIVGFELGTTTMALGETIGRLPEVIACAREDQKEWFSFPCTRGEKSCAYALTEPSGGSELSTAQTRGRKVSGGWKVSGNKIFISHADRADFIVVLAVTDETATSLKSRFTAFIVERGAQGLGIGRPMRKMGWNAYSLTDVSLADCFVPDDHVLGEVGHGFEYLMRVVNNARMNIGARCAGNIGHALRLSTEYGLERRTFGARLVDHEAIQFWLADMDVDHQCTRLLVERAAALGDAKSPEFRIAASRAKLFGSEACGRATDKYVQILGGAGYVSDFPAERMFRDARAYRIGEGTSEMQRLQIARDVTARFSPRTAAANGAAAR